MRAGMAAVGREQGDEDRCLTMTDIDRPFKAFHTFCLAVALLPFSVPCPGATHSCTALLCYARLAQMRPATYRGQTIYAAFQHLLKQFILLY